MNNISADYSPTAQKKKKENWDWFAAFCFAGWSRNSVCSPVY